MAKFRCGDCGTVYDSNLQECPSCGCPASACSYEPEQPQTTPYNENSNTGSSVTQDPPQKEIPELSPMEEKRKMHPFEITCYVLAGLFAVLWLLQQTTSGSYANFDGAIAALRKEIAAFGFLIAGRLTGILNK